MISLQCWHICHECAEIQCVSRTAIDDLGPMEDGKQMKCIYTRKQSK